MSHKGSYDSARGLLSSLNRLAMRPTSPSAQNTAPQAMPPDNRARHENMFNQECQGKPYLTGIEAAILFLDSRLHKQILSNIWEQADVTRDGRFSCEEFCHAMWLIDKEKGVYPSNPEHQHPQYNTATSTSQGTTSWTQPPAYSQQPQQSFQPNQSPYGFSSPPTGPPLSTMPYNPSIGFSPQPLPIIEKREMLEPLICQGCEAGLVPGDTAYCCDACKDGVSIFCEPCYRNGRRCYHSVAPRQLEAGKDLKNENKDGDFGFGLKCDGCKTKLKQGMLCWHCKRCFDPNFCKDCWKRRDKRCKHAGQGKVQLRRVGKSSGTTDDILETVADVLIG